jgi:hypothetical protein
MIVRLEIVLLLIPYMVHGKKKKKTIQYFGNKIK